MPTTLAAVRQEAIQQRQQLLAKMPANSVAILSAASEKTRNHDAEYAYRQSSDFWHLTGFTEPESLLILAPQWRYQDKPADEFLICRPRDKAREIWDGYRLGAEGAVQALGMQQAASFDPAQLEVFLSDLLNSCEILYYDLGENIILDNIIIKIIKNLKNLSRRGKYPPKNIIGLHHLLHEQRLIKSEFELSLMRHAAEVSAQAHIQAMQFCKNNFKPNQHKTQEYYEYHLASEIEYYFAKHNMTCAYSSIVGSGANGCILHYRENQSELKAGDLVLIDAGAEYYGYAADITRTFPINGTFSYEQQAIYELVLAAQTAALAVAKPNQAWDSMQTEIVKTLTQGLVDLKLLTGDVSNLLEKQAYLPFYMHSSGHWLGRDVHDVGVYKTGDQWRLLQENMVLTVEPGLYIAPDEMSVPENWRGIGIRIEDDIVINNMGHEVLTKSVPKTIEDLHYFFNN